MNALKATRSIRADPQILTEIILNIAELADWNPALNSTRTQDRIAKIDHPYPVSTRIPGRATLTYIHADQQRIVWRLDVAGNVETGEWQLEAGDGASTRVTHRMSHSGALFALMQNAMRQVPTWRLDRLQERAESRR